MSVIVNGLVKTYGSQNAVNNISFTAKKGEITGFLGPNGAGKSTTMKIITCFNSPTQGSVTVCGQDVVEHSLEIRKKIGYLPEHNPLYLDLYIHEYLRLVARLQGISKNLIVSRVAEMIELCGLTREQNKKIGELSKGYRQRVGLAQALIHDPEVLILDEPTTGLDPNQLKEIRSLIKNISKDKTVILSTHIMQEVKALCDRVVIINKGELVADDHVSALTKEDRENMVEVHALFSENIDADMLTAYEALESISKVDEHLYKVILPKEERHRTAFIKHCIDHNLPLIGLRTDEKSIEEVFQNLTR